MGSRIWLFVSLLILLSSCRAYYTQRAIEKGEVFDKYLIVSDTIYNAPITKVDTLVEIIHDTTIINLDMNQEIISNT